MRNGERLRFPRRVATTRESGFTLLVVLFAIVVFGLGLAAFGESWSRDRQRQKEGDLLRIGQEFVTAIEHYYRISPGVAKTYPKSIDDLLEDKRFVAHNHYLRRVYRDPITNKPNWGLIEASSGGIAGVYSLSGGTPLRATRVDLGNVVVGPATRYSDWKFAFDPDATGRNRHDDRNDPGNGDHERWIPARGF
jgi:type II secretory pathway pseudopilin PulG